MKLNRKRKGITPVIAIVLLLMVTVGAVGVVYTQFQSLVGDPTEQIDQRQRNQNTDLTVIRGITNKSSVNAAGPATLSNRGVLILEIQNTGSVTRNTTAFRMITTTGQVPGRNGKLCTEPSNSTLIDPDETIKCHTGIVYPQATNTVNVQIQLKGSQKSWSFECRPQTTGQTFCM
ncbi:MAG: archaellin/type IV pilin N-terminal domain-containing protein [Candidatus Nanosalina sp.]